MVHALGMDSRQLPLIDTSETSVNSACGGVSCGMQPSRPNREPDVIQVTVENVDFVDVT